MHTRMTINQKIEALHDFPAIQRFQSALWGTAETHGAAVLVGAGFSRTACLPAPNSPKPPLWSDFVVGMKRRLYGHADLENAPADPLRLAQEFKAALGQPALDSLIYEMVPDEQWLPGTLHKKLVDLPWTDILTTNWDTLLERATEDANRTYHVVSTISDIPRMPAPRVVKLHGSMPSIRPFIFTEEDYRTYPKTFAPFVNLVQQVLMESDLCLLGFSGDDPNFLQWTGWIRDELGDSARYIYMVGVLELSPSRRKYLEARKVIPIDLAPLVAEADADEKHALAMKHFLEFLENAQPQPVSEWDSSKSSQITGQLPSILFKKTDGVALTIALKELLTTWKREHEEYPGWLVCPSVWRERSRFSLGEAEQALVRGVEAVSEEERAELLYQAMWRCEVSFFQPSQWLCDYIGSTVENADSKLTRQQRSEIGTVLLRIAREARDRTSFDRWIGFFKHTEHSQEIAAAIAYESALWARDDLDYLSLAKLVPHITGDDPAWKLKRAGLMYDLGESDAAAALASAALTESRARYNRDRRSLWNVSRLAWSLHLLRASQHGDDRQQDADPLITSRTWPDYVVHNRCNPWDELDALDQQISEGFRAATEDEQDMQPLFDPGTYTKTVRFSNQDYLAQYETFRLADSVGTPAELWSRLGSTDFMRSRLSRALALSKHFDERDLLQCI